MKKESGSHGESYDEIGSVGIIEMGTGKKGDKPCEQGGG